MSTDSPDSSAYHPADYPAVAALLQRVTDADGVEPLSEAYLQVLQGHRDGEVTTISGADGPVAVAVVIAGRDDFPAAAEIAVDPVARRLGHGSELLRRVGPQPQVWAHGNLPSAQAFAARHGLLVERELLQLRRPLAALPVQQQRPDLQIRTYRGESDDAEIRRVNNDAFDWHPEQGGWELSDVAAQRANDWFDPQGLFLAFDAAQPDTLLGFHWTKVPVGQDEMGEVYIVGVDGAAQGRGIGRALTLRGLHYLADRGLRTVNLYVEGNNDAAVRTYRHLGFDTFRADVAYRQPLS